MSGAIEPVDWHHSADELHERYRAERNLEARKRLGALWLVRRGESVSAAAQSMGIGRRTLTRWLSWYREGGLEGWCFLGWRAMGLWATSAGYQSTSNRSWSSERGAESFAPTRRRGGGWKKSGGIECRYKGMYALLARLERFAMILVHEPSWGDGRLFGRSQKEDSRGRGGAAHEPERGRSRFRGEPLLGQALREGGARGAFALAREGSGQATHAR